VTRPPNLAVTLIVVVVAFGAILILRGLTTPASPDSWWLTDADAAFAQARAKSKPLVIDYQARWSIPSMEMSDSLEALRPHLTGAFVPLRVDVSDEPFEQPGIAFVDASGKVLARINYGNIDEIRRTAEQALRNRRR
jgi:hypothetical protein